MNYIKDGGPAFPTDEYYDEKRVGVNGGMTLRDYFAAAALPQAIEHERSARAAMIAPADFRWDGIAHAAYAMADAMLRERRRTEPNP